MQIFVPYAEPIKTAKCLDSLRLNKQIIEARQILDSIDASLEGKKKGWFNHPVTKMYKPYKDWLHKYMGCLIYWNLGFKSEAMEWSKLADSIRPPFLTADFCIQHRKRLYTKNSEHYKQFAEYGTSDENWYYDNESNQIIKYINGKRIK